MSAEWLFATLNAPTSGVCDANGPDVGRRNARRKATGEE